MESTELSFECELCNAQPPESFAHFDVLDNWIGFYPEQQMLHIHFGRATHTQDESDQEADWLDTSILSFWKQHPGVQFYVLIDLSRADDSEFPSEKSRNVYRSLLGNDQMYKTVFFGVTPAMRFLIKTLVHVSGREKDIFIEKDSAAAEEKLSTLRAQG